MIIVRYGEIGLKGKNRRKFESLLAKNIETKLKRYGYSSYTRILRGRIFVYASDEAAELVAKCPGVVSVSVAKEVPYENLFDYLKYALEDFNPRTFKVDTQRIDKNFPKKSQEINEEVGDFIVREFGWKVSLDNPEMVVGIEVINSKFYVYFDKIPGVGGLPVGSAGKLVLLISPGIDSPVAGYLMMKRGAKLIAVHMKHSDYGEEKVRKTLQVLNRYSPKEIELVIVEHQKVLKDIAEKLKRIKEERWTCVFCKYTMVKMAEEIVRKKGALGIVTGDSLGQVASQTLHNMYIVSQATKFPIYRPLIGMDKNEIERIARYIGTYDIFISSPEETCPFKPRYVVAQEKVERFENVRKKIGL